MEPFNWAMVSGVAAALAVALSIYSVFTARGRKEYDRVVEDTRGHEDRLTKVEAALGDMPRRGELHELRLSMEGLRGQLAVIVERVEPIKAIAERLQEVMLERGK